MTLLLFMASNFLPVLFQSANIAFFNLLFIPYSEKQTYMSFLLPRRSLDQHNGFGERSHIGIMRVHSIPHHAVTPIWNVFEPLSILILKMISLLSDSPLGASTPFPHQRSKQYTVESKISALGEKI